MPSFSGIDHVAVTVTDLGVSVPFYVKALGLEPVGELAGVGLQRRIFALPNGAILGLTQHVDDKQEPGAFSPFTAGLDHVGFGVSDRDELRAWAAHLDAADIDNSGIVEASYGAALSFTDPDGTALEFFVGGPVDA